jgi:DNA-binding transcriptional LysR family regulator
MRGVTLRQLRAFAVVARHQSFVRAATELHLTPSAVSLQIKELEQTIGMRLFARNGKSVSLTHAADVLLVDVRKALLALKSADDSLVRLRGQETGLVTVGMVSNAKYFVPRLLARFRTDHRGIELRLAVGNREQLVSQLCAGTVDVAIMGEPPRELDTRSDPFAAQPLSIVAAPEHGLAGARAIPAAALADHEFIVREPGSGTRAAMERFFRDARIAPPRVMEMTSNETIKQAVIANMGIAFLSLHTVGLELKERLLVVLDVVGLPLLRRWHVVNMGAEPLSDAAESLRSFIVEQGGALIARQFGSVGGAPTPAPIAQTTRPTDLERLPLH